jgi:hypothetical protein
MTATDNSAFRNRKKFRVGGSGFTAFLWEGLPIGFANGVKHNAPSPVAQSAEIQPLDARYPLQIITPGAITGGSFEISLFEMYNSNIWDDFVKTSGLVDLSEIFLDLAARNTPVSMMRIINPPKILDGTAQSPYGYMYHNCVVMNANLNEEIDVATMTILKGLTVGYTHSTKIGNAKYTLPNTGISGGSTGVYGGLGYF